MADNLTVLNSTGGTFTLRMKDVGGGVLANMSVPTDVGGNTMVSSGATFTSTAQSASVVVISSLSAPHTVNLSSVATVTPSSALTVTPSSALQVTLTSATVTLSSAAQVTLTSNTVALSSAVTATITSVTSGAVSLIAGANTANIVAGSSAVTSTMSALVVALSTLGNFSITTSSQVQLTNGTNTANVLAGSSTVTSTMSALVVAISSNGAGVIGTGTPTTPSSQYISAVVVGDLALGAANSSASNPVAQGGTTVVNSYLTATSSFQRASAIFDPLGKQITLHSARGFKGNQITYISSTTETNVVTASSLFFQDVYGCIVANPSSLQVTVTVKDSSGGTTQFSIVCPAGDTRGFVLPESGAFKQTTSSAAWSATLGTVASSVAVNMMFVKNTA